MVQVISISKIFVDPSGATFKALDRISFNVEEGEIFGLIGLSGAGKSTALRAINLIERPEEGAVLLRGVNLMTKGPEELRKVRQKIGMIFQHFNLLANRTVEQNVSLPLEIAGWPAIERRERVQQCLELVRLTDKRKSFPAKLSGGQKQRVAIARAIANNPYLLLADEPTSALDPITKGEILSCLSDINAKLGLTIVIATHEMSVVRRICDRVMLLKDSAVHEELALSEGQIVPQTAFGKYFLEAV
jgi:D-methionine transport system ATP-binding protein